MAKLPRFFTSFGKRTLRKVQLTAVIKVFVSLLPARDTSFDGILSSPLDFLLFEDFNIYATRKVKPPITCSGLRIVARTLGWWSLYSYLSNESNQIKRTIWSSEKSRYI